MPRSITITDASTPGAGQTITGRTYRLLAADGTTVLSTAAPPYTGITDAQVSLELTVTQSDAQTNVKTRVIPGRVTDLAASSAAAPVLTWTDVGGETSYEIHRGASGFTPDVTGATTRVGTTAANAATFTDSTVTGNGSTVYGYRVVALAGGGYTIGNEATCTPASGFTPFDAAFNFRANNTDVGYTNLETSGEAVCIGEVYPHTFTMNTTSQSASAGFSSDQIGAGRNRSTTVDHRLAGMISDGGAGPLVFKCDVAAGATYSIRLAAGDPANDKNPTVTIKDGATTLATVGPTTVVAGHTMDAMGTDLTDAAWPGSNVARSVTMTGTVLSFELPGLQPIQHIRITRTA